MTVNNLRSRAIALRKIDRNIEQFGQHVYLVKQHILPRYAYTIGLSRVIECELLFAGGVYYMADDVFSIVNMASEKLRSTPSAKSISLGRFGEFSVQRVDVTWSRRLMLGAIDYFNSESVPALQLLPAAEAATLDIPDCTIPLDESSEPVWQWLLAGWQYPIPETSVAITDLYALKGAPVVEAVRWEVDQWEMFSGPGDEFDSEEVRIVPLATMLGIDQSLVAVTQLEVGDGLIRSRDETDWHAW